MKFETAIAFVKDAEGLCLNAYQDGAGVLTIGWGHTGPDVRKGLEISRERADELLQEDMAWVLDLIKITVRVPLNEGQGAAITSLIFNIGSGAWRRSTILRRLNAGDMPGAAREFPRWNKITVGGRKVESAGLVNRRKRERAMFEGKPR